MVENITLPKQSDVARAAAEKVGARCAVVLTVNHENDKFETRCYGVTDEYRYFAGSIADAVLAALDEDKPPADYEQALNTIAAGGQRQ